MRTIDVHVPGGALLGEGETRVVTVLYLGREREVFLLRHDGALVAYLNECPHWSVDLDLGDGDFFDRAIERIYCKNHGALFHPLSGVCETGPCLGRALTKFQARTSADDVLLEIPVLEPFGGVTSP